MKLHCLYSFDAVFKPTSFDSIATCKIGIVVFKRKHFAFNFLIKRS